MRASAIKKQVENYLPLLTVKQQTLVLEMIKSLLNVDTDVKRISSKQYNKEVNEAVQRIESGKRVTQKDAEKELNFERCQG
jgi:L-lactate utilization protein LutC